MREMKNSGVEWIGEIPVDWEFKRIKEIFTEVNERCNNANDFTLLSVSEYYGVAPKADRISSDEMLTHAETLDGYKICIPNDLVMNIMLAWKRALGVSNYTGIVSPAYCVYRPTLDTNAKYFHYLFRTDIYASLFKQYSTGIIDSRLRLYSDKFFSLKCHYPCKEVQTKIADVLDEKCAKIDAVIARQQQVIEKLKEYKLSVITEAVTKGLDPTVPMKDSGVDWIGKIPESWKIGKIKSAVFKVGSGKTPKGGSEIYSDEGVLFIRSQNVYDEGLKLDNSTYISSDIDNEMSNTRVYSNDVLLNITGGSIGRTCIYPQGMPHANVNQHVCIIRTKEDVIKPEYMHYFWMSFCGKTSIDIFQTGANREGLNFEQINNTKIPYISLDEQAEIIAYLDKECSTIDSVIAKKQSIVDKLTQYKKSLIYEVVTGKKEV